MWLKYTLDRLRQNHALEHATINLLSQKHPGAQLIGVSGPAGFTLYSQLTAEEIITTAREALDALKAGHSELAIHPNCGTNLVIAAALTAIATTVGLGCGPQLERRSKPKRTLRNFLEQLPYAILFNVIALIVAVPLGRWVQVNVTTYSDLKNVEIASFFTDYRSGSLRVRVYTRRMAAI